MKFKVIDNKTGLPVNALDYCKALGIISDNGFQLARFVLDKNLDAIVNVFGGLSGMSHIPRDLFTVVFDDPEKEGLKAEIEKWKMFYGLIFDDVEVEIDDGFCTKYVPKQDLARECGLLKGAQCLS